MARGRDSGHRISERLGVNNIDGEAHQLTYGFNKEFKLSLTNRFKGDYLTKVKGAFYLAISLSLITGCAAGGKRIDEAEKEIVSLRQQLNEANSKIGDLNNKFMLLHEKVDASRAGEMVPEEPPEGLRVVNLGEVEAVKPVEAKPKKAPSEVEKPGRKAAETPEAMYSMGQDLFISGRYEEARKALLKLVKAAPVHPLADNALYWVAESYYSEKEFEKAASRFKEVAERYPQENKAPDALLKAGYSYAEMNEGEKALSFFDELIKRYPDSEAAFKAKKTLEKLSGEKKEGQR